MKTVTQISRLAGVSVRTLHHYDAIGLLKPTQVTEAGYRLYDEAALERLYTILVFRELGLSLKEIGNILEDPTYDRQQALDRQIRLMREKTAQLQNRIGFAQAMKTMEEYTMDFENFDPKKMDDYTTQAKVLYGKTDAYKEYSEKAKNRTGQQEQDLGSRLMDHFARLGEMMPCPPDCEAAQQWAKDLQAFITAHYYTCTPQILQCLAESYAGGGSMNENIDKAGGAGTGAFAKEVIDLYLRNL